MKSVAFPNNMLQVPHQRMNRFNGLASWFPIEHVSPLRFHEGSQTLHEYAPLLFK